jgi:hypothetical protein
VPLRLPAKFWENARLQDEVHVNSQTGLAPDRLAKVLDPRLVEALPPLDRGYLREHGTLQRSIYADFFGNLIVGRPQIRDIFADRLEAELGKPHAT